MQNNDNLLKKGLFKHIVPVNNEWINNNYSFNNDISLITKDKLSNIIVKSYISSTLQGETRFKRKTSKRMKDLLMRSTTKQVFVSNTEIKHTNKRVNLTVYVFDRNKQILSKRFSHLMYWLSLKGYSKNSFHNSFWKKKYQDFQIINHYFKPKFANILTYKKLLTLSRYKFVKWTYNNLNIRYKWINNNLNTKHLALVKDKSIIYNSKIVINNKPSISDIVKLNNELFNLLLKLNQNSNFVNKMFSKFWKKEITTISRKKYFLHYLFHIFNNYINLLNNKLHTYTPFIKAILSKIYNKDITINLVYLKYIHLNIDLLLQAIAVKLKKRKSKLLKILKRSLKLVHIPKQYKNLIKSGSVKQDRVYSKNRINPNYRNLLTNFTGNSILNIYNDKTLNNLYYKLFTGNQNYLDQHVSNEDKQGKLEKVVFETINSLKHKYVTGIWINAKGRLTKRFTASRALFKSKHKGSLENLDQFRNKNNNKKNLLLLRNINKSNVQLGYVSSKKHIGVFGLKAWVSSN